MRTAKSAICRKERITFFSTHQELILLPVAIILKKSTQLTFLPTLMNLFIVSGSYNTNIGRSAERLSGICRFVSQTECHPTSDPMVVFKRSEKRKKKGEGRRGVCVWGGLCVTESHASNAHASNARILACSYSYESGIKRENPSCVITRQLNRIQ